MLKSERDALLKLCRQREKVAKSAVAARRKADFERQLAAVYAFDQSEVWKRAVTAAKEAWRKANEEIACEAVAMGIPLSLLLRSVRLIGLSAVRMRCENAAPNSLEWLIAASKRPRNTPVCRSSGPRSNFRRGSLPLA